MKTWATELFSNHNFDNIITKWCYEYSHNITSVVLYLQAEKNSRVETGIEPDAPQVFLDGHGSIVNSNINSDDESNNKGMDTEDDGGGDQSSWLKRKLQDVEDDDAGDAEDDNAGDLIGRKKSKRQSSRLKRKVHDEDEDEARDLCVKKRHSSRLKNKQKNEDEVCDLFGRNKHKRENTMPSTAPNSIGKGADDDEAGANKDK
jgi:hypothetical protein